MSTSAIPTTGITSPVYVRNFEVDGVSGILSAKRLSNVPSLMIDTELPVSISINSSFSLSVRLAQNAGEFAFSFIVNNLYVSPPESCVSTLCTAEESWDLTRFNKI